MYLSFNRNIFLSFYFNIVCKNSVCELGLYVNRKENQNGKRSSRNAPRKGNSKLDLNRQFFEGNLKLDLNRQFFVCQMNSFYKSADIWVRMISSGFRTLPRRSGRSSLKTAPRGRGSCCCSTLLTVPTSNIRWKAR